MRGDQTVPPHLGTGNLRVLPVPADVRGRLDALVAMLEAVGSAADRPSEAIVDISQELEQLYEDRKHESTPYFIRYSGVNLILVRDVATAAPPVPPA